MKNNAYLTEEYEILNPTPFALCIDDARFVCLNDSYFEKAHPTPQLKQLDHLHSHSYYELFFVEKGPLIIRLENGTVELNDNDLIIISPETMHRSFIPGGGVIRYNLNFYAERLPLRSDFSFFDTLSATLNEPCIIFRSCSKIKPTLKSLGECIRQSDKLHFSAHFHYLLTDIISTKSVISQPGLNNISDESISRIYKIHHVINLHYMDDISAGDIAKMLFLSVRQVNRIIRKHHGCSFLELITKMRMDAAADLLRTTNMKILEIASFVGYNSLSSFYTAFTRRYGCLPTKYRKSSAKAEL